MILRFNKILRALVRAKAAALRQYRIKTNPVGYARSLGVQIGDGSRFYGMRAGMFGTEPWLISIGKNVQITAECQFITHDGGTLILRKEVQDLELTFPISIGDDVYIGIRTIILPGVKIGNRCIIAAGSVVSRNIPDNSVAAGVPARVLKTTDAYLEKAKSRSLHMGHLSKKDKEVALMALYGIQPPAFSEVEEE